MYAVIQTGGKQYRVAEGQVIRFEKLPGDSGQSIDFNEILMVSKEDGVQVGSPLVAGAKVTAQIFQQGRAKKIRILKFRRRKHHMKRMGHRQNYTQVKITSIQAGH